MSKKRIKDNNPDIYGELVDFQDRLHAQNLKRIHIGLLCVLIIPMIFLALMFITDSNKVIWLILWIVSLFAISAYLIIVEYGDYNLQHRINSITGSEAEPVPLLESGINDMSGKLASVKAEARDIIASAKASVNIDDEENEDSEDYAADIDTELIKESLSEDTDGSGESAAALSTSQKDKKSGKKKDKKQDKKKNKKKDKSKDKKKKKKNGKKKSDKKDSSGKKGKKSKVKEDVFDE